MAFISSFILFYFSSLLFNLIIIVYVISHFILFPTNPVLKQFYLILTTFLIFLSISLFYFFISHLLIYFPSSFILIIIDLNFMSFLILFYFILFLACFLIIIDYTNNYSSHPSGYKPTVLTNPDMT